ncbi:MAG: TolC family protein [Bacteriovoracaceae bacterium]|nr:TolC family protein [Bacteriovoracaceae bacterium]
MLTKMRWFSPTILTSILLLQACAPSLPTTKNNSLPLPPSFPDANDASKEATTAEFKWNDFFHDEKLTSLIESALKNNQELHLMEQEVLIANNEIMSRQGEYLPKFKIGASGGIEKIERFSSEEANSPTKFGNAGFSMNWEIDIWKKLRNASKSAYLSYLGTIEARRFMVTNLVAEIANTYYELLALDNQLNIVDSYIEVLSQIRDMVTLQQSAARVTSLAVRRFEAEVFKNKSRKYSLEQQIIITQNKINTLLGRFPQQVKRESLTFAEQKFDKMHISVPSKLLEMRPDIKKASYDLEAAKLNVDVARARFYPSLSIDGAAGYENFNSKHFDNPVTTSFYGVAAGLSAPILNRKAIKADYFSANNKQIQALYNYELTLIKAFTEVTNQIKKIENLNKIYDLKVKQVTALTDAINVSNTLFRAARVDYIEALFTQRDALEAQIELIDIKKEQLTASVDLYRALGGGWRGLEEKFESNY